MSTPARSDVALVAQVGNIAYIMLMDAGGHRRRWGDGDD